MNILSLAPPSGSTGKKRRCQQVGVLSKNIKTAGCNSYTAISHAWRMQCNKHSMLSKYSCFLLTLYTTEMLLDVLLLQTFNDVSRT